MKIRIKFTKTGTMRFIGHLDLMRYFQKLMRRAKVDIRYSEGFSPHQIMSFATAMGLGMTSEGEYVDIEVLSTESSEVMIRRLNAASNEEIQILRYCQIPDETKSAMSQIAAADYVVSFPKDVLEQLSVIEKSGSKAGRDRSKLDSAEISGNLPIKTCETESAADGTKQEWLDGKIAEFCSQESIVLLKKTKKSEQEVDIRPMIFSFSGIRDGELPEIAPAEEYVRVFLRLATGSEQNLKPELVMEAFFHFLGLDLPQESTLKVHRMEIYGKREDTLIPLSDFGWDIL